MSDREEKPIRGKKAKSCIETALKDQLKKQLKDLDKKNNRRWESVDSIVVIFQQHLDMLSKSHRDLKIIMIIALIFFGVALIFFR